MYESVWSTSELISVIISYTFFALCNVDNRAKQWFHIHLAGRAYVIVIHMHICLTRISHRYDNYIYIYIYSKKKEKHVIDQSNLHIIWVYIWLYIYISTIILIGVSYLHLQIYLPEVVGPGRGSQRIYFVEGDVVEMSRYGAVNHIWTVYEPYIFHILTIYEPYINHILTVYEPYINHILTIY